MALTPSHGEAGRLAEVGGDAAGLPLAEDLAPLGGSGTITTLRRRLLRGTKWSAAAALTTQASGVVVTYALAHSLGQQGMGEYGIIQSTLAGAGVMAGMAFGTTATKYVAEFRTIDRARAGRYIGLPLVAGLLSSACCCLLVLGFGALIAEYVLQSPRLTGALRLACPLLILNTHCNVQMAGLAGLEAYRDVAKGNLMFSVSRVVLCPAGAYLAGLEGAIVGAILAETVLLVALRHYLKRKCAIEGIPIAYRGFRYEKQRLLGFSLPAFLSSTVIGPVNWLCNIMLVSQPGGYAQMGVISVTSQWQTAVRFIPLRILDVGLPILSSLHGLGSHEAFRRVLTTNLKSVCLLTGAVSLPIMALSPLIMRAYGPSFAEAYPVLVVMVLSAVLHMVARVLTQSLLARGQAKLDLAFALLRGVVLLATWWALLGHGALGLAGSICGSYLAVILALSAFFNWRQRLPPTA